MDLICPECRSILTVEGRNARCMAHGGQYEVLFDREAQGLRRTSGSEAAAPSTVCTNHPRTPAAYTCPKCSRPICTMCAFEVGGKQYCPDCATHAASGAGGAPELAPPPPPQEPAPVNESGFLTLNLSAAPQTVALTAVPPGLKCAQHANLDAAARCRVCSNGMCAVCDFALPNGMHVCPACIENRGTEEVSPRRTYMAWGGIAAALLTTILFAVDVALAAAGNLAGSRVMDVVVLICAVGGVWLSFTPFEPALGNTAPIWVGVVWNTVILSVFVLLSIVATFSS